MRRPSERICWHKGACKTACDTRGTCSRFILLHTWSLSCSPARAGRTRAQVYAHALLSMWTGTRNNYVALFDMDEYMVIDPIGKRMDDLSRECWPDYAELHLHRQVPRCTYSLTRTRSVCQRHVNQPNAAYGALLPVIIAVSSWTTQAVIRAYRAQLARITKTAAA